MSGSESSLALDSTGRPVIAYASGGARETIVEGVTGTFFGEPEPATLADAVRDFDDAAIAPDACARNADRFSVARFQRQIRLAVEEVSGVDHERRAAARERARPRRRPAAPWRRPA